jgi:hypothetical protein
VEEVSLWVHNYGAQEARVALSWVLPLGWTALEADPTRPIVLTLAGRSAVEVRARCQAQGLASGQEYCLAASITLDGRPRDRVAVYYRLAS